MADNEFEPSASIKVSFYSEDGSDDVKSTNTSNPLKYYEPLHSTVLNDLKQSMDSGYFGAYSSNADWNKRLQLIKSGNYSETAINSRRSAVDFYNKNQKSISKYVSQKMEQRHFDNVSDFIKSNGMKYDNTDPLCTNNSNKIALAITTYDSLVAELQNDLLDHSFHIPQIEETPDKLVMQLQPPKEYRMGFNNHFLKNIQKDIKDKNNPFEWKHKLGEISKKFDSTDPIEKKLKYVHETDPQQTYDKYSHDIDDTNNDNSSKYDNIYKVYSAYAKKIKETYYNVEQGDLFTCKIHSGNYQNHSSKQFNRDNNEMTFN